MGSRTKAVLVSSAIAWVLLMPGQDAFARTVCEKQWDGYQWTDQCRTVGTTRRHYSVRSRLRSLERRAIRYLRYGY